MFTMENMILHKENDTCIIKSTKQRGDRKFLGAIIKFLKKV